MMDETNMQFCLVLHSVERASFWFGIGCAVSLQREPGRVRSQSNLSIRLVKVLVDKIKRVSSFGPSSLAIDSGPGQEFGKF